MVLIHSASTPANGPSPTATTNNIAKTISLIERNASITRRNGWWIHHGVMFSEQRMPSGTEQTIASTVPHRAICTVTSISLRYMRHSWKSGGKKSAAKVAMFPESRYSAIGFISAPCQAQASRTRNRPQPAYCGQVRLPTASAWRVVMRVL
ncbi:hypothetical protein D3C75_943850 [compost metagenome]